MKLIAFDTETKGLDYWNPDQQAFLATWADEDGEYHADLSTAEGIISFCNAIAAADGVIAHNLSFDVHQVKATLGLDVLDGKVCHDTDLMSRVLFPTGQGRGDHSLKGLAKVHLRQDAGEGEDAIKEAGKAIGLRTLKQTGAYHEVWRAYPEVMEKYARLDARYTYDLFKKFEPELGDARRIYDLEMAVAPILIRAEERGIKTDQVVCKRLKVQYTAERDLLQGKLAQQLGDAALRGDGSEDALREALLGVGIPLHRKTPTGQLSTNQYALAEFAKDHPVVDQLMELRRLEKFLSTYIGALDGVDVVHPSFRQLGAWTGRMSCTRPNMQNIPKRAGTEVRSILVPREGYSFVVVDYDSIEARLLAYYLNDPAYSALIDQGHDPHAWMAAQIHGGKVEDYHKGTAGEKLRNEAKNVTFAISYGAGAPRVSDMLGISREQAKSLIAKVKSSLPNFYSLNKRIRTKIEGVGYVNTLFGRKNPVSPDKAYVGLNALIQGSAADIMKQGLVNVAAVCGGVAYPLLVVHDEVVLECRTENAADVLSFVEAAMVRAYDLTPRLAVSGSICHHDYSEA